MSGKLWTRVSLVVLLILIAAYVLYPSIKYYGLTNSEKTELAEAGKLNDLEKKILHPGLDLQGGMHVVLEVDLEKLLKSRVRQGGLDDKIVNLIDASLEEARENDADFFNVFNRRANAQGVRLALYFPSYEKGPNDDVVDALEADAKDAVDRAEEIIRNRVDQFGVSEPNIQRQGQWRVIVELAGVTDQAQARGLIQATALLEFVLVREDPQLLEDVISKIDKAWVEVDNLKKNTAGESGADAADGETTQDQSAETTEAPADEEVTSLEQLLGEEDGDTLSVQGEGDVNRPFSSLISVGNNVIWVPAKNYRMIQRYLEKSAIREAIPFDSRFTWGSEPRDIQGNGQDYYPLYLMKKEAELTGDVITDAKESMGGFSGAEFVVHLTMNGEGAKKWAEITAANIDKRVAIVLDDKVQMAPVIRSKIADGRTQIEGLNDITEAKHMAIVLRAGALPAPMQIEEERSIGASLGADSVRQGTNAVLIGFVLVVIFMILYYRGAGLIADMALILNLLFTLAVLAGLGATLTLPGIAGLILTVGMSVDANVLIFERIREELRRGKTVRAAIDTGYSKAITTILDANITTVLAALVLWQFGTGTVKGFATVLFWGILSSMVTAIFVSRTVFNIFTERRTLTKLSI
ncbi:MAG: protein translocase subunit SecD [Candidatus Marinimicrobia bacterium]|nr:protein translocase subunit SecD [Candidatus Neomarinimicrobiota bacterium]MCF7839486.1 protein translocase subunit SecD [Candidatus Neomarinimicrobiota bacterium]MCF7902282.1 protein translocase subunit SecD [Candidatus Neomarinimicrobiota bacterium]